MFDVHCNQKGKPKRRARDVMLGWKSWREIRRRGDLLIWSPREVRRGDARCMLQEQRPSVYFPIVATATVVIGSRPASSPVTSVSLVPPSHLHVIQDRLRMCLLPPVQHGATWPRMHVCCTECIFETPVDACRLHPPNHGAMSFRYAD